MSATPPTTVPVYIELDREGQRLLVRWADQHESAYGWEYLRWRCPCAECSGEGAAPGLLQSLPMFRPGQTMMNDVNLTGRYGLTPTWGDGHSLGIYTFRMLRAVCPCDECVAARGGEAPKGRGDW